MCLRRKSSPGYKTCAPCRKAASEYSTKRYEEQRAARRCARSGCPNPATGWLCDEHKALRKQRRSGKLLSSPTRAAKTAATRATKTATAPAAITPAAKPAATPVTKPATTAVAKPAITPVAKPAAIEVAKPAAATAAVKTAAPSDIGTTKTAETRPEATALPPSVLVRRPPGSDGPRDPVTIAHEVMSQAHRRDPRMPSDEDLDRLARAFVASARPLHRQLYISLTAAKQFAASHGFDDVEAARRRLQVLLDSAHPTERRLDIWRARHADGADISVRVDRDTSGTDLLVVVGIINVRGVTRATTSRNGHRAGS